MDCVQNNIISSTLKRTHFLMDKLVILVLLCSLVDIYSVLANDDAAPPPPPNVSNDVTVKYRIEGRNAVLSCHIKHLGSRKVIWSRVADPYPISISKSRFNPSKKYRVAQVNESFELTIQDLELDDGGEYMCRASGAVYVADIISLNIQTEKDNTHLLPTIKRINSTIGATVLLPCHVENLDDNEVLWRNAKNTVISLRKKNLCGDRRFKVIHRTRVEWSLRLQNIQESDFGYYICVINANPVLTRTVHLIDSKPPKAAPILKLDTNFKAKVEVMAGETVTLTCNFKSNPPTKVQWYIQREKEVITDGKKTTKKYKEDLNAKGNNFVLQEARPEQSGVYLCYGRNGIKPPGKGKTRLIVKEPPTTVPPTTTMIVPTARVKPHVYVNETYVYQKKGMDAKLECLAIGLPRPQVHWRRHERRIEDSYKFEILSEDQGKYKKHTTLVIRSLMDRDYGPYSCSGANYLGLKTHTLFLRKPEEKPAA